RLTLMTLRSLADHAPNEEIECPADVTIVVIALAEAMREQAMEHDEVEMILQVVVVIFHRSAHLLDAIRVRATSSRRFEGVRLVIDHEIPGMPSDLRPQYEIDGARQ